MKFDARAKIGLVRKLLIFDIYIEHFIRLIGIIRIKLLLTWLGLRKLFEILVHLEVYLIFT